MKVLQLYNQYRSLFGGEQTVVEQIADLVERNGGQARLLLRSSRGLDSSLTGKAKAFVSGIYNPFAAREVSRCVDEFEPDLVHVHNLYPLFSPSVLVTLKDLGVPIVMTVHNQFHTCPTADHFHEGRVCERCVGGREYHCVLQNCRGQFVESVAYALRSAIARKMELFTRTVTVVVALNDFARRRLARAGFDANRIVVVPNSVPLPDRVAQPEHGSYAMFSGRMCAEKGVATLLEAAARVPEIPVSLFGAGPTFDEHRKAAPPNALFLGQQPVEGVAEGYRGATFLVVPSRWFEGCPLVILEAMASGIPVIASNIGGLPELVEHGVTGLLFEPGNSQELADAMRLLWTDRDRCREFGAAGRAVVADKHDARLQWERLRSVYDMALNMDGETGPASPGSASSR